jgi:preprotein translocase subunit SecF
MFCFKEFFEMQFYGDNYLRHLFVPVALFVLFVLMIAWFPGITKGMDLTGGTLIVIRSEKQVDALKAEAFLKKNFQLTDLKVNGIVAPGGYGLNIQFASNKVLDKAEQELNNAASLLSSKPEQSVIHSQQALKILERFVPADEEIPEKPAKLLEFARLVFFEAKTAFIEEIVQGIAKEFSLKEKYSFQKKEVGPSLGETFWENAVFVAVIAFIAIVAVIFLFFREVIPSFAVIAAAVFDISGALALMALTGIPLGLSSIPALLMLVGYSVDTDIMLTTRLLKGKEANPRQRSMESLKTGLTMTLTTIAAVSAMLLLAYVNQMAVIFEIAAVLLFGLSADLISTWMMNAPVLLWYVERRVSE